VRMTDFLKFLNRVSGHVSAFFRFVDQVVPASQDILEKGILLENPFSHRTIVAKTAISHPEDPVSSPFIDGSLKPSMQPDNVDAASLDGSLKSSMQPDNVSVQTIDAKKTVTFVPITSSSFGRSGSLDGAFSLYGKVVEATFTSGLLDGQSTGGGFALSAMEFSASASDSQSNTIGDGPVRLSIHFPRSTFSPVTKTVFSTADILQ